MRRVDASEFVSLDGVMEDPRWTFRFSGEGQKRFKFDELSAADALLLGMATYEGFAVAWPSMMEQYEGPRRAELQDMLGIAVHHVGVLVSRTLEEPLEWSNSTLIEGNVAEEISRLKQQPGKDVLIFGSADLVHALMQHDLIDEHRIMVFPVVVGSGKHLFGDVIDTKVLKLANTEAFGSGAVVLTCEPAGEEADG